MHQALTNLIANAVHHTTSSIEIRAFEGDGGDAIYTEVTSHGDAIPKDVRERLFDPFATFDSPSARKGLGLGLHIVQQIALAHRATPPRRRSVSAGPGAASSR